MTATTSGERTMMRMVKAVVAMLVLGLAVTFGASSAHAEFAISEFSEATTSEGPFNREAGAHPDLVTRLIFNEAISGRTAIVNLPPGLLADPTSAAVCPQAQLVGAELGQTANCPVASQVGLVDIVGVGTAPVYNVKAPSDLPGLLAFTDAGIVTKIEPRIRSTDYGITTTTNSISQALRISGVELRLWGVPSDPIHDSERVISGTSSYGVASEAEPRPFITNPAYCGSSPLGFSASADSWWNPGVFINAAVDRDPGGVPFIYEGCDRLRFEPSGRVEPDTGVAGGPLGLDVSLKVPQNEGAYGYATPQVKKTVVTFPKGVTVSSAVAHGLGACSVDQVKLGSDASAECPASSRIGSVTIQSPLLETPLEGEVVVARQGENPFGSLLALYIIVPGPGLLLKLPGRVDLDQTDGQLQVTFDNTPQLPFESLRLTTEGGPNAVLVAPSACGEYAAHVEMTSWASTTPVSFDAPMKFTEGCAAGGFSPKVRAGTADPTGGSFGPFTLQVTRQDGEENLLRIQATLPPGLLAKLAGVPLCGNAQTVDGDCPAASQVGTTTIGVGVGANPLYIPEAGKAPTAVYLAGPYKGAPYSLVVKVPAQAGPFDLGTVVVRNALHVDPITTQVTTESDPLPQILEGIPVSYRDVRVEINRPEFTVNPTNCSQFQVTSVLTSAAGQTAGPKAPFAAANCERLGLKPKLAVKFSGAPTRRGGHPKLTATLTTKKGDANLKRVQVTLPKTEYLENAHIRTVCTRVQYAADACPKASVYGHAEAWTPLLDKPLEGPVYLRSSNHTLPDLVASLDGQIHVDLAGRIDSVNARIRNTFETVPDAPVTKFQLTMQGGGKGLLVNNTNLCKASPRAKVVFDGQNQKTETTAPLVSVGGCGKGKKAKPKGK